MTVSVSPHERARYNPTRHRGLSYRVLANGGRRYFGYVPGRGRVPLRSSLERDALAEYGDLRGKAARGEKIAPANVRFCDVAEEWLESKRRLRTWTRRYYRIALDLVLLPRFGHRKLGEIDASDIAKLIRDLETEGLHAIDPKRSRRPLSASSIQNYLKPLAGTLGFALRRGLIGSNPYLALTRDDRPTRVQSDPPHEWSDAEIEALLSATRALAARSESKYDYAPLIETAASTGLRLGELLGLQFRDLDLDARDDKGAPRPVLTVGRQWSRLGELTEPKTRKGMRRVPLTPAMVALLRRLRVQALARGHASPEDFVFASKAGTPLSHRNVQRRGFEPARKLAKLPNEITFHDLRHAFASYAAHRGVPAQTLSEILGHAHVGITQSIYQHLYNRDAAEDAFRAAMSS